MNGQKILSPTSDCIYWRNLFTQFHKLPGIKFLEVLEEAQRGGWGYDKIAHALQDPQLLLWRARMIARTETLFASDYGRKLADDKSEYETGKEWISANDHRTRHGHRDVDGEVVDQVASFAVPVYKKNVIIRTEMMTGPGDITASAENVINCRCTAALVPLRDESGKTDTETRTRNNINRATCLQRQ